MDIPFIFDNKFTHLFLYTGGEDRFEVDRESGVVRTRGNQPFRSGKDYEIGVSARDVAANSLQKSSTHSLRIRVGERNPQFYKTQYKADIREDSRVQDVYVFIYFIYYISRTQVHFITSHVQQQQQKNGIKNNIIIIIIIKVVHTYKPVINLEIKVNLI